MSGLLNTNGIIREGMLYIERPADEELHGALLRGEFCYVLAPRQIGKSSLRFHTTLRLRAEGVRCAAIDLTRIGTSTVTAEQWYRGLLKPLPGELGIDADPKAFWQANDELSAVDRFTRFLREVVLARVLGQVVLFIDEIDAVLGLPFPRDDFFSAIRSLWDARAADAALNRLSICLLGVAAPSDLMSDPVRTPFNIGRAIHLEDLTREQAAGLLPALAPLGDRASDALDEIYQWTSGHPYMTQKLCATVLSATDDGDVRRRVRTAVEQHFLLRGSAQDPNLGFIDNFFSKSAGRPRTGLMLRLYRRLLHGDEIPVDSLDAAQRGLRVAGIASAQKNEKGECLSVRNQICKEVFNADWVRAREAERSVTEPMNLWREAGRKPDFLLRGEALEQARDWTRNRDDVTSEEREFIEAAVEQQRTEQFAAERERERRERAEAEARARRRTTAVLSMFIVGLVIALGTAVLQYQRAQRAREDARLADRLGAIRDAMAWVGRHGQRFHALVQATRAVIPIPQIPDRHNLDKIRNALCQIRKEIPYSEPLWGFYGRASSVQFSPDGKWLLAGNSDGLLFAWESGTSRLSAERRACDGSIRSIRFAMTGPEFVVVCSNGSAHLWHIPSLQPNSRFPVHGGRVDFAIPSPSGWWIAGVGIDGTVYISKTNSSWPGERLKHDSLVVSFDASPTGTQLLTASQDGNVQIWRAPPTVSTASQNVPTIRVAELLLHGPIGAAFFLTVGVPKPQTPPGISGIKPAHEPLKVIAGRADGGVWFWQPESKATRLLTMHQSDVSLAIASPAGDRVLVGSSDGTAEVIETTNFRPIHHLEQPGGVYAAAFASTAEQYLVTNGEGNTLRRWSIGARPDIVDPCEDAIAGGMAPFVPDSWGDIRRRFLDFACNTINQRASALNVTPEDLAAARSECAQRRDQPE